MAFPCEVVHEMVPGMVPDIPPCLPDPLDHLGPLDLLGHLDRADDSLRGDDGAQPAVVSPPLLLQVEGALPWELTLTIIHYPYSVCM